LDFHQSDQDREKSLQSTGLSEARDSRWAVCPLHAMQQFSPRKVDFPDAQQRELEFDRLPAHMTAIIGLFTDLIPRGGVQRASRHVAAVTAKFAADHGITPRFLSLNDPQGIHLLRVGTQEFSVSGYARNKIQFVRAALKAVGKDPALVIALHPHLAPIAWLMKSRNGRLRSMIFAHGVEVWQPLSWPRASALRSADQILGPSTDTVRHLIEDQRIASAKVAQLPWALDPEFEARVASPKPCTRPPGFPQSGRVILAVGRWDRHEQYKGADTLIAAMPQVLKSSSDASLVLVGDGDDRPRLEQLARQHGVSERVYFLHSLTLEQLFACYANCDVFALPSSGEGFGLVFLEAMAYGKPVIGGAHGGIPDIVEDGVTGHLVPHGDVGRLADSLSALLLNPVEAAAIGAKGKERVDTTFSFARFQMELERILDSNLRT
jgi:glycosyltransferase involved in cell wall biosynthesis